VSATLADNTWINAVLRLSLKTCVYFGLIGGFVQHDEALGDNFGHVFTVSVFVLAL
jgi:hypothetical protein